MWRSFRELRACFTKRVREDVTDERVKAGQKVAKDFTLDDLVDSVIMGEEDGRKTAKIKMKGGRTLTTLILVGDKWLADRVWFY